MSLGPTETPFPPPPPRDCTPPGGVEVYLRSLSRILDETTQPFVIVGFDGRFLHANRAFADLVGFSIDELREMAVEDLTPHVWMVTSSTAFERLRRTGSAQRYEKVYQSKDGRDVHVSVVLDLWRDENDVPRGYFAFITDVGERLRAEAALRASEERFRRLFDEAPFGYHEIDPDGVIRSVNRTECELLGYAPEEMIGRPVFDFLAPADRAEAIASFGDRVRTGQPLLALERHYVTKDGRERVCWVENRITRSEDGRITGLRSTLQDITERKQTEAALVASERRARALFGGIEDAVFVHDEEGRILDANPAACRQLGYTREELLRLNTRDIDDPDFAAGYAERLDTQIREGRLRCEGRHRTKDGRLIPVDINTSTVHLEDQPAVLAVIRDITERKALEEMRLALAEAQARAARELEAKNRALRHSEARYRQLTEGCLDAIVVTDAEGQIILFNPAAGRTFGYEAGEVLGRPFIELMPEDLRADLITGLQDYLSARSGRLVGNTLELRGRRKNGESFPLEISLSAIDVAGELQFLCAIRDLTERQRMRAMLMQSDKLASIGLLSAGVAHEINNPLAFVANNLAVLERDLAGILSLVAAYEETDDCLQATAPDVLSRIRDISEELDWPYVRSNLARMLSRTRDGVQRVANVVQNLRGLARTSPPKLEPAHLGDLLTSAVEMIQGRLRRSEIALCVRAEAKAKIACVPTQIGQVMLNLLVNAIQAVEEAGRPPEGRRIEATIRQTFDHQILEVEDTGMGIPPEAIPQLFDPFFTTKPVGEGTGLGLSISHGIVTGHGGRIDVESELGRGTCFRVYLPWKPA